MIEVAQAIVAVDIGTTSTKAAAFAVDGKVIASAQRGYALSTPQPGRAEQDADDVLEAVLAALSAVVAETQQSGMHVTGVSFSAAMHSLVGLDAELRPVTPLTTWADQRAKYQARRLRSGPRGLALHRRTGMPVHPMSPVVRLRWYLEEEPETFRSVRYWAGIKEYVLGRLTGELVMDHSIASATGMFHLEYAVWDSEALAYAGISAEQLPALVPTTTVLKLRGGDYGLSDGAPIIVGAGDGPLANLGLGAVHPGTVACSIGTSGALRVTTDRPAVDDRGRVFCYALTSDRWVIGGAINNGGIVLEWLSDAIAPGASTDQVLAEAALSPAGSGGLLFLPYLLGERAPHWSGSPRGAYIGLTREHRRPDLLRSALEGVCLQLAVVMSSLSEAGVNVREIRATGGFSRSPLWRSMLASAFGRPIGFAASAEGSSLGAALLGMTALGLIDSLDHAAELVSIEDVERPNPRDAEVYGELLPIFDSLFDALIPAFEKLPTAPSSHPLDAAPPATTSAARPGAGTPTEPGTASGAAASAPSSDTSALSSAAKENS